MFVIIHGPLDAGFLQLNMRDIRRVLPGAHIVIAVWQHDVAAIYALLSLHGESDVASVQVTGVGDIFNPGFCNVNRHIHLIRAGLALVPDDEACVIKLRMDQTINFYRLHQLLNMRSDERQGRLLTTNCYTRRDRLYHPSDMFMVGQKSDLERYFPATLFPDTHLDCLLKIQALVAAGQTQDFHSWWPESRLFLQYLTSCGERPLHTRADSERLLKKYVWLVNSWDIGLRWRKFFRGKCCVLPYTFTRAPFDGGPRERAENYQASDLHGYRGTPFRSRWFGLLGVLYFSTGLYRLTSRGEIVRMLPRLPPLRDYRSLVQKCLPPAMYGVARWLYRQLVSWCR